MCVPGPPDDWWWAESGERVRGDGQTITARQVFVEYLS